MALHSRPLAPPLSQFVNGIYLFESAPAVHKQERALPDGCAQLIINLREDRTRVYDRANPSICRTFDGALVVGPQTEYCVIDPADLVSVASVHFKPGGAAAFFALPVHELHGRHVPLEALWGGFARELRERLLAVRGVESKLDVLETALLMRLHRQTSPVVQFAIGEFRQSDHQASVADVVSRTGYTARHFIELFRREVGFTPKLFHRVTRFQRALRHLAQGKPVEWTLVAMDAGYFDQAHFIHDFREFSGLNPSTYRQLQPRHPNHVPVDDPR